jgi:hypothetical protein
MSLVLSRQARGLDQFENVMGEMDTGYLWQLSCSSERVTQAYLLVHKYMRQPRLMKSNRINIDGNYLSSDVVSIALAYFLNSQHPSLKYAIQFLLIDTPQNLL